MKILRRLFLAILILATITFVGLWTLPAEVAWRWAAPRLAPLELGGFSGTVWEGEAARASVLGQPLGALSWRLEKATLLHGEARAHLALGGGGVEARGELVRVAGGTLRLHDAELHLPAALAQPAVEIKDLRLLGEVAVSVAAAELAGKRLANVHGTARWMQAGFAGAVEARFGDVFAEFASQPDGGIAGTLRDDGSQPIAIAGQFTIRGFQYEAEARLSARNDDPYVREALRGIGAPQPDGSSLLQARGPLFKLF